MLKLIGRSVDFQILLRNFFNNNLIKTYGSLEILSGLFCILAIYKKNDGMRHISKYEDLLNEDKGRDTLAELKEMALGQLERIADYANMIKERMEKGEELESWMYSQLTTSLDNLNAVHDAMDGNDGKVE